MMRLSLIAMGMLGGSVGVAFSVVLSKHCLASKCLDSIFTRAFLSFVIQCY